MTRFWSSKVACLLKHLRSSVIVVSNFGSDTTTTSSNNAVLCRDLCRRPWTTSGMSSLSRMCLLLQCWHKSPRTTEFDVPHTGHRPSGRRWVLDRSEYIVVVIVIIIIISSYTRSPSDLDSQGTNAFWKFLDFFLKFPGPEKSWKISLVLASSGK